MASSRDTGGDQSAATKRKDFMPPTAESPPAESGVETLSFDAPLPQPHADLRGLNVLRLGVARRIAFGWCLNHFALGAWYVTMASYIKANTGDAGAGIFADGFVGRAGMAAPIGAAIAPFLTGVLADRVFAMEKLMAALHFGAAVALWAAAVTTAQTAYFALILGFFVCYLPTMSLMAAMSMHHLPNPRGQYPVVRSCGTMGWIVSGIVVGSLWPLFMGEAIEEHALPMKIGAVGELLGAIYCFALPTTPPSRAIRKLSPTQLAQPEAGKLLQNRQFLAVLVVAFLSVTSMLAYSTYLNAFMNWRGSAHAATRMTLGQVTEVICMIWLPVLLMRTGLRVAVIAGMVAWIVRYGLLAYAAAGAGPWAVYLAIGLHGIAFVFVSISLQLEVDAVVDKRRRAAAQGIYVVATQGLGSLAGAFLALQAEKAWLPGGLHEATASGWEQFWLAPVALAAVALVACVWFLPRSGGQ